MNSPIDIKQPSTEMIIAMLGGAGEEATVRNLLDRARQRGVDILDVPLRAFYGPLPDSLVRPGCEAPMALRQLTLEDT